MQPVELIGRTAELKRIDAFLDDDSSRRLMVSGPAGIGKTVLLEAAANRAAERGYQVMRGFANQPETHLPYASLRQLLEPTLGQLKSLPAPQRAAIEAAFGLTETQTPPEVQFIGLGALRLLDLAANKLVLVFDDGHWFDEATRVVMEFIWRRVSEEPIRMIVSTRRGPTEGLTDRGDVLFVGPLGEQDARLLAQRSAGGIGGDRLRRVLELAAGNPLALRELSAALPDDLPAAVSEDLPLETRLELTFSARLRLLSPVTRAVLLAAALSESDLLAGALAAATELTGEQARPEALIPAEQAALIRIENDRLLFQHPLIASAIIREAGLTRTQGMHRALSASAQDEYAAIWHRGQAAAGPDEQVAAELERAAGLAASRGATLAARAAMMRAAALSADEGQRARRLVEAAEIAFDLGDPEAVGRLMEEARAVGLDESSAARLAFLEGRFDDGISDAVLTLDRQVARAEAALAHGSQDLASNLLVGASRAGYTGVVDDEARAQAVLDLTAQLRLRPDDANLLLIRANLADSDEQLLAGLAESARGPAQDPGDDGLRSLAALVAGDWTSGHLLAGRAVQGLRDQGRLSLLAQSLAVRGLAGLFLGHWEDTIAVAEQGVELARETEQKQWYCCALSVQAGLAAVKGRTSLADRLAAEVAEFGILSGNKSLEDLSVLMRGLALLGADQPEAAYQLLVTRVDAGGGAFHPRQSIWAIDLLAEAAVGADRAGEARERLDRYFAPGPQRAPAQVRALALAQALLSPDDIAEQAYLDAGAVAVEAPSWFRARLDLNHGMWLRRQRRGSEARALLQPSVTVFEHLGAVAWEGRARRGLGDRFADGGW